MESYGDSGITNWGIVFGDFIDEGKGVKPSPKEKLNSLMKTKDAKMFEHWRKVWLISVSCFIILTAELVIPKLRWFFESCESNYPPQCNNN